MRDVVQVVTTIGDTIIDVAFVEDADGAPCAVSDAPVRTRVGIAEVTRTRVPRPARCVPRPAPERRPLVYIALSLAAHLCIWSLAPAYGIGGEPGPAPRGRHVALRYAPPGDTGEGDEGAGPAVSMRLEEREARAAAGRGGSPMEEPTADLGATIMSVEPIDPRTIADRLAGDRAGALTAFAADHTSAGGTGSGEHTFGAARSAFGAATEGPGWGTIESGAYGTLSAPAAAAAGTGQALRREGAVPRIYICGSPDRPRSYSCVKVVGEHDKKLIQQYVRRNLDKLQYCYEKALLADPTLAGIVETEFLVAPSGRVESATAHGVSPAVASCVEDVLRAIEFPRLPSGEKSTQVHYPFTFRSAP